MSNAVRPAPICASPTTPAATGTAPSAKPPLPRSGSPTAGPNSCPYFHVVFTLPGAIADIAFQNNAVVYDLLLKVAAETLITRPAGLRRSGHWRSITKGLRRSCFKLLRTRQNLSCKLAIGSACDRWSLPLCPRLTNCDLRIEIQGAPFTQGPGARIRLPPAGSRLTPCSRAVAPAA